MQTKKTRFYLLSSLFLFLLFSVMILQVNSSGPSNSFGFARIISGIKTDSLPDSLEVSIDTAHVNYKNLYDEIVKKGIKFPKIVWAQAVLESGHFKSNVFNNNKNLFGMMMPRKRNTVALPSSSLYAKYDSWQSSVYDYKLYQDYIFRNSELDEKEYYRHLDRRYCYGAGCNYSTKLKKIIAKYSNLLGS